MAVAPETDILAAPMKVTQSIKVSIITIISVFAVVICIIVAFLFYFVGYLTAAIIAPIDNLSQLCDLVIQDNLSQSINQKASSSDMLLLLNAFSNLMTALRYGSETYAKGNAAKSEVLFKESLALFTNAKNLMGQGKVIVCDFIFVRSHS